MLIIYMLVPFDKTSFQGGDAVLKDVFARRKSRLVTSSSSLLAVLSLHAQPHADGI